MWMMVSRRVRVWVVATVSVCAVTVAFLVKFAHMRYEVLNKPVYRGLPPGKRAFRAYPFRWLLARSLYYPWVVVRMTLGHYRQPYWYSRIDDTVILGALPVKPVVQRIAAEGVRGVINMCEEFPGLLSEYEKYDIRQLHLPTIDFTCPALEDIERAIEFIEEHRARGERVYVHCKAGKGRSATIVLCYIMHRLGPHSHPPERAQRLLQQRRPFVTRTLYRRATVHEFYRRCLQHHHHAHTV